VDDEAAMRGSESGRGGRSGAFNSVLLGTALVGSVLVLASLVRRPTWNAQGAGDRGRPGGPPEGNTPVEEEGEIPLLEDAVDEEELRRPPVEPPVLTDEVVPGRAKR
jgi:hypothetical protein